LADHPPAREIVEAALRAHRLSRWELATGLALGADELELGDLPSSAGTPREVLAEVMGEALCRTPCAVSFSGGRDSSAVLAVATEVARRQGFPDPVPVTLRFPGVASTEESQWQELVVRHLRLREWEQIPIDDELDLLGLVAQRGLREHGLLWPPNVHVHVPMLERARGGCLLTGFDGDGLLGDWRWSRPWALLRGRARPWPRDLLRFGLALAPRRLRSRWMRPTLVQVVPWLRDEARAEFVERVRADAVREPRRWDRRIGYYRSRRYVRVTVRSLGLLAASRGLEVRHPLLDDRVLAALAVDGGATGYGDRTAATARLFGDLLPAELIARRGKAEFGRALWKPAALAFAAGWDGSGLDDELVDPERVRQAWRQPNPLFGSNTLLQLAWLRAQAK
jgi:asparagine synthase (glutamine-hydrolysing)